MYFPAEESTATNPSSISIIISRTNNNTNNTATRPLSSITVLYFLHNNIKEDRSITDLSTQNKQTNKQTLCYPVYP